MILANARHELFARQVADGIAHKDAFIAAGFSAKTADAGAARLVKKSSVSARICELQVKAAADARVDAAYVLERLREIVDAKRSDFERPRADWTEAMERIACEVEDITERSHDGVQAGDSKSWDKLGVRIKIRLSDKLKALNMLGNHKAIDAFVQQQKGTELHLHLHAEVENRLTRAREIAAAHVDSIVIRTD